MPNYAKGLGLENPKPNKISTLESEAYLNDMANEIKRTEYVDFKISHIRKTVYWD